MLKIYVPVREILSGWTLRPSAQLFLTPQVVVAGLFDFITLRNCRGNLHVRSSEDGPGVVATTDAYSVSDKR